MTMEKRGVISEEDTPHDFAMDRCMELDDPMSLNKEAADKLESHPVTELIDAAAEQSAPKRAWRLVPENQ